MNYSEKYSEVSVISRLDDITCTDCDQDFLQIFTRMFVIKISVATLKKGQNHLYENNYITTNL